MSDILLYAAVFCWPIFYLFNHVFPRNGFYNAIGNDFYSLYYKYKLYLLACLSQGHFPLWSPAEGAGYAFRDNPFTQALYPLNLLLVIWYKISGGYNPLDHQIFTVLGISIFALGLFLWLKTINNNLRACFFATLVMSVSFRVTEATRFPNAVHTFAWYPWVLYAITKVMFSQTLQDAVTGGIILTLSGVLLCTGGYPYCIYYSIFLFVPYTFIFLVGSLKERLFDPERIFWRRAAAVLLLSGFLVILICGPYLQWSRELMAQTAERPAADFAYSTKHQFTFEDTIGSLVYPPASSAEGWYFFSITALLVILLYLFAASKETSETLPVKLFFVGWFAVISYITYGKQSYLFELLWKYLPGFARLRVWPRLNIVLVPILAWMLSVAYNSFETSVLQKKENEKYSRTVKTLAVLAIIYAVILGTQLYMFHNKIYNPLWLKYFKNVASSDIKFIIYGAAAFIFIFALIILNNWRQRQSLLTITFVLLIAAATIETHHVGANMWTHKAAVMQGRISLDVAKINRVSFQYPRRYYNGSISLGSDFGVNVLENWYFERYMRFLRQTENELEARKMLLGQIDGRRLFFSESIEYPTVSAFLHDALRYRENTPEVLSYTGDELILKFNASAEGYLSFIDNWDYGWKVFVDGKEEKVDLLFGTFKSVKLSPGMHHVRFSYQPGWFFRIKK